MDIDPETTKALIAAGKLVITAKISQPMLEKLLGPTFDYLGQGLKGFAEKRADNINRIFAKAAQFLGSKIETPGTVPPKLLKAVLEDGSFADDELTSSYFGGILASSRSTISRDDRGTVFNSLIGRLSTYQIRAHYVLYHVVKRAHGGSAPNLAIAEGREAARTFLDMASFIDAMAITPEEASPTADVVLHHTMFGLAAEGLIEPLWKYGSPQHLAKLAPGVKTNGIVFSPSVRGIELFLWGHGSAQIGLAGYLATDQTFALQADVILDSNFSPVGSVPAATDTPATEE